MLLLSGISSCVKDKFDAPPNGANEDPKGLAATMTIAQFKSTYFSFGQLKQIPDSVVIVGVVNGDDKSGNLYKTLSIQDSTGGIQLVVDQTNFYTDYPVGRRVFVKCKNLFIGDYSGMVQLGAYIDNTGSYPSLGRIPSASIPNVVVKGKWGLTVDPVTLTLADLNTSTYDRYQSVLIKVSDMEFACSDVGQIYGDQVYKQSLNRVAEDCAGDNLLVRSSGYANFANSRTPGGKGDLVGIFSIFKRSSSSIDRQLVIRDTTDVKFSNSVRCDGTVFGGGSLVTLGDIRTNFNSVGQYSLQTGAKVRGVVVADNTCGNFGTGNLIIQDGTGGITLYFGTTNPPFVVGDSIEVNVSCATVKNYQGLLEITGASSTAITKLGTSTPKPTVLTVNDLNNNFDQYESMLIQINNAQFTGGTTFGSSPNITDGTGTIKAFNFNSSCFGSTALPTGTNLTILGVSKQFNTTNELSQRSAADAF